MSTMTRARVMGDTVAKFLTAPYGTLLVGGPAGAPVTMEHVSPGGRPATTTADDWAQAALDEIEAAGVRALTVEGVARRLGVSKGGAYHHFRDRRDLLRAALARWERHQVTELNARFAAIPDP